MAEVRDVLNAAADLLEKPGAWTQGAASRDMFGSPDDDDTILPDAVCWCAWGAILKASGNDRIIGAGPYPERAVEALQNLVGSDDITQWNDAPGRTQAEVVAALRSAAQSAGAEG